jgi:hypothetical protein
LRDKIDQSHAVLSAGQTALRDKMDHGYAALISKIDSLNTTLSEKIDKSNTALGEKIDKTNARIESVNADLRESIAALRGLQKAMLWVLGGASSVVGLVSLGKSLHWF